MGSHVRLEHCSTARFDPGVKANIPEHAAVRTFSSGQRLRDLSKAQPCAGVKVQVERKRKRRAAAGEGCQSKTQAAKSTKRLQRAPFCENFLSRAWLGALSKAQPTVRVRIRERCSLWHCV